MQTFSINVETVVQFFFGRHLELRKSIVVLCAQRVVTCRRKYEAESLTSHNCRLVIMYLKF